MKRCKLYLSIFLFLCCSKVTAQEASSPTDEEISKKKEINKIKMSEEAVYADIMEIATDADITSMVHQKSHEMLQAHVIEIFAKRMKMNKKDVQEIWDVIDDKCQNIVVKKGDVFRVFSYIMKDAIGLGPKKPKEGDVEKYMEAPDTTDSIQVTLAVTDVPEPGTETPVQPIDSVAQTAINIPQEVPAQPIDSTVQVAVDVPQEVIITQLQQPEPDTMQPEKVEVEAVVTPAPVVQQPTPSTTVTEIPEKVKIILHKSSMNEVVRYLNMEKQNHTLIYGNMQTMQNPEKCYIVIIDKTTKKVVAILSQGSNNRMNYVNGKPDDLNNYKGGKHSAIFVQEF